MSSASIYEKNGLFFYPIQKTDIPEIMPLLHSLGRTVERPEAVTATEEEIAALVFEENPAAIGFVARDKEGRLMGYSLLARAFSSFKAKKILYIEDIVISEAARGTGAGKTYMSFLADYALKNDYMAMQWLAEAANKNAISFYGYLGAEKEEGPVHFWADAPILKKFQAF